MYLESPAGWQNVQGVLIRKRLAPIGARCVRHAIKQSAAEPSTKLGRSINHFPGTIGFNEVRNQTNGLIRGGGSNQSCQAKFSRLRRL
jgi:hypothetical protein